MFNPLLFVMPNLTFFGDRQRDVVLYLTGTAFQTTDDFTKGAVTKMLRLVNGTTSSYEKDTIIRCLEQVALFSDTPVIFVVSQGEDFAFEVDLEEGRSFEGYDLRAYNAESGVPLGPPVSGTAADKQDVPVVDLDLPQNHVYRCHVVLQSGTPSSVLLVEAFLVVEESIDYDEVIP